MAQVKTRILPIASINPPDADAEANLLDWFHSNRDSLPQDQVNNLLEAAHALQTSNIPVAFPTETVYGLGADATRSEAVRGIYTAKQRPSDNPLIVHVGCLGQLRSLLQPPRADRSANGSSTDTISYVNGSTTTSSNSSSSSNSSEDDDDLIPPIYAPLIRAFWPGPLTLLFPLPHPSPLAPEVTSSLTTVGIRMPSSPLARLLISLSDRPLAAPSANASTRPSPTTAAHVLQDLEGRVEMILDGGACRVGVESTVVDGVGAGRPMVLRPGGVGIQEIRELGGVWAGIGVGYRDREEMNENAEQPNGSLNGLGKESQSFAQQSSSSSSNGIPPPPRAPGMKYRHYAPRARVHLFEVEARKSGAPSSSSEAAAREKLYQYCQCPAPSFSSPPQEPSTPTPLKIGIIATSTWRPCLGLSLPISPTTTVDTQSTSPALNLEIAHAHANAESTTFHHLSLPHYHHGGSPEPHTKMHTHEMDVYSVKLGPGMEEVARGIFAALRALDERGCGVIFVEGVGRGSGGKDGEGEGKGGEEEGLEGAVMNRLRKAAEG